MQTYQLSLYAWQNVVVCLWT